MRIVYYDVFYNTCSGVCIQINKILKLNYYAFIYPIEIRTSINYIKII